MVAETGQPYAYTGDDPVNGVDPLGLCTIAGEGQLYAGPCATTGAEAIAAERGIQAQAQGGFSITNGLKAVADYGAAIGNVVTSTVTLGHVHVAAPYCGFGWASDVGNVFGFVALAVLGGGAGGAAEVSAGAETVAEAEAGAQAPRVLLDTNAVIRFNDARALIQDGEQPVVTQSVLQELSDVAARKGFSGLLPGGVDFIADEESAVLRSQVMDQLRGFEAKEQGIEVDAQVGATALSGPYPLITGDDALGNSVAKLGGEWRRLP